MIQAFSWMVKKYYPALILSIASILMWMHSFYGIANTNQSQLLHMEYPQSLEKTCNISDRLRMSQKRVCEKRVKPKLLDRSREDHYEKRDA